MFIICVYQKYVKYRGVNLSRGLGSLHARPVWPNLEATGAGYGSWGAGTQKAHNT